MPRPRTKSSLVRPSPIRPSSRVNTNTRSTPKPESPGLSLYGNAAMQAVMASPVSAAGTIARLSAGDAGGSSLPRPPISASGPHSTLAPDAHAIDAAAAAVSSGGRPLTTSERDFFEPRFGADLGGVRIHDSPDAGRAACGIRARAFALGNDIAFSADAHQSQSPAGRQLLAHELAHVVQNRPDTIGRWEASEHNFINDRVYGTSRMQNDLQAVLGSVDGLAATGTITLANYTTPLCYSDVAALADHFRTFDEMYNAPAAEITALLQIIRDERRILITDRNNAEVTGSVAPADMKSVADPNYLTPQDAEKLVAVDRAFTDATGGRYILLAKDNGPHFTYRGSGNSKNDIETWKEMHGQALQKARESGKTDVNKVTAAFLHNSFADHYLADTFASGHLTGNSPGDQDIRDALNAEMAVVVNEALNELTCGELDTPALIGAAAFPAATPWVALVVMVKRLGLAGAAAYLAGMEETRKLGVKVVHDLDNVMGRMVTNAKDQTWEAYGDKRLLARENLENLDRTVAAVESSKTELLAAFEGTIPTTYQGESLYPFKEQPRRWGYPEARARLKEVIKANAGMLSLLWEDDDIARTYMANMTDQELALMSAADRIGYINVLLGGACLDEDENTILRMLDVADQASPTALAAVIADDKVKLETLLDKIDGEEYDKLLAILKRNYLPGLDPAVRQTWVLRGARGYTYSWEEKLIKAIMEVSPNQDFVATVEQVDAEVSSESDDIIVDAYSNADGEIDYLKVPANLTAQQAVVLCRALISGACVGNDERAVRYILSRQSDAVFSEAVDILTPAYIDSGLDGWEWDAFLADCAMKYPPRENVGTHLIGAEKNDDAARLLVRWLEDKSKIQPADWIDVIRALLSGDCGDDDENAIIAIVRHLKSIGKHGLVNTMIGEDAMDSGVDGAEWRELKGIMGW